LIFWWEKIQLTRDLTLLICVCTDTSAYITDANCSRAAVCCSGGWWCLVCPVDYGVF
jgi:hypothetical protein